MHRLSSWCSRRTFRQSDIGTTRQYASRGFKARHPATLLAILMYGYSTGVFSSRKLEMAACCRSRV